MGTCLALLLDAGCASRPKRDPEQSQIRYQIAAGNFREQRIEAAIEELQKALQADPENADAYNMLGIIALRQGHDYVVQLESASCLKGKDAELVRGEAQAKFNEAIKNLRKAVELRPEFPEAWNNLSVAEFQLQSWDAAIEAAQNALKDAAYGTPEMARANLGWAYYQKKDIQSAWKELHEAVSRAPGFCVARYRLAKIYVDRGEIDQAVDALAPVIADVKRCPIQEAQLLGGLLNERKRDLPSARELFQRCVDMGPRSCIADECRRYAQLIQ
ncbi:MAG: tetratricopeptide repeat protein [Polyangia bacterium]|jgi:Tfp pilus assembly protein PilF